MKIKRIITSILIAFVIISIAFVIIKESRPKQQKDTADVISKAAASENKILKNQKEESCLIVYYFHGNMRCRNCMAFEQYTRDAMDEFFAEKMREGKLIYKVMNVDDNENEHFISDYSLTTKSVVLVKFTDGKEVKWKNLDEIWKLVANKKQFINYIKSEVNSM
jgi:hypothetical protein